MNELPLSLFLYAESPLHVGSGGSLGAVDLPIQRERSTQIPTLPGSGIRGALREQLCIKEDRARDELLREWFGNDPPDRSAKGDQDQPQSADGARDANENHKFWAGAVHLDDARLLLMPVRSVRHGWAWVTAKVVIDRLNRDLDGHPDLGWDAAPAAGTAWVAGGGGFLARSSSEAGSVLLEDIEFPATVRAEATKLASWIGENCLPGTSVYEPFKARLAQQLVVLSDEDFKEFCLTATEVVARVRMDPIKHVVAKGALWTEELLPAEALLWSSGMVSDSRKPGSGRKASALRSALKAAVVAAGRIRLGGDQGIGRGRVALVAMERGDG